MRLTPASMSVFPARSAITLSTTADTDRQVIRSNSHTTVAAVRAASHAHVSSNAAVKRLAGRAHGTAATTTPCSRHDTRGASASKNTRVVPRSNARHRRRPPPWSYPLHLRSQTGAPAPPPTGRTHRNDEHLIVLVALEFEPLDRDLLDSQDLPPYP